MLNVVIFEGRFTKDPELKTSSSGNNYATETIAVESDFKGKPALFLSTVFYGAQAKFACQNFKKGDPIHILGRIETDEYTDKSTGNKVSRLVIVATQAFFPAVNTKRNQDQKPYEATLNPTKPEPKQPYGGSQSQNLESLALADEDLPW